MSHDVIAQLSFGMGESFLAVRAKVRSLFLVSSLMSLEMRRIREGFTAKLAEKRFHSSAVFQMASQFVALKMSVAFKREIANETNKLGGRSVFEAVNVAFVSVEGGGGGERTIAVEANQTRFRRFLVCFFPIFLSLSIFVIDRTSKTLSAYIAGCADLILDILQNLLTHDPIPSSEGIEQKI